MLLALELRYVLCRLDAEKSRNVIMPVLAVAKCENIL